MNLLAKKGLAINFNNIVLNNSDGGTNIFNGFRHKSNDGPQNDEVKIEFGFKGEDLLYRQASKEIYVGFTFLHGYTIYPDDIKKWRDGSKLTEAEKEKVFIDLVNFVNKKRGKPIVIINTDDASKALWEDLCSTHASVIDKIVYTSDKEDFELNRTSSLATIRSGGAVILDNTEITNTNVEDLDNALANEIRKTRERLDN